MKDFANENLGESLVPYSLDGLTGGEGQELFRILGLSDKEFHETISNSLPAMEAYGGLLKKLSAQNIRVKVDSVDASDLFSDLDLSFLGLSPNSEEVYMSFAQDGGILVEVVSGGALVKQHVFNNSGYRNFARYVLSEWESDKSAAKGSDFGMAA